MVDYDPWDGDFVGTTVHDNVILGGFATDQPDANQFGNNFKNAIIKYALAFQVAALLTMDATGSESLLDRARGSGKSTETRLSKGVRSEETSFLEPFHTASRSLLPKASRYKKIRWWATFHSSEKEGSTAETLIMSRRLPPSFKTQPPSEEAVSNRILSLFKTETLSLAFCHRTEANFGRLVVIRQI